MATELTVQSERAFQKQPHIFLANKTRPANRRVGKGGRRWYKDIGLGFKTPKNAIEGTYIGQSPLCFCGSVGAGSGMRIGRGGWNFSISEEKFAIQREGSVGFTSEYTNARSAR